MKKNVNQLHFYFLWIVLFPPLHVGDRVVRGPDWQWGAQGNNEEGIVVHIKDWKGIPNCGVSVQWDNGDKNMYRYGADNCYDVMDAYPMRKADYQPIYGLNDSAESTEWIIELYLAYWSRYVNHYIRHGLYKSKGFFAPHLTSEDLIKMLPDYEVDGHRDSTVEQEAFKVINQVIEVAEKDILVLVWIFYWSVGIFREWEIEYRLFPTLKTFSKSN